MVGHKKSPRRNGIDGDGLCIRRIGKERRPVSEEDGAGLADQNGKARIAGIRAFLCNGLNHKRASRCYLRTSRVTVVVCFVLPLVPVTVMV
jgi:hypothetical protein